VIDTREKNTRTKWQILAACSLIICINAAFPIYGASVVNTAMVSAMKADRSLLGTFIAVNMLVTGLTAPLVGALVSRFGARPALIAGSLLLMLGALTMATLVHRPLTAILTFGIIIGLGMSLGGFVANQTCTAEWFRDDRARPFGVLYATMGVGGFVAAPLINLVILRLGTWQAGWLVFVVLGAVALCLSIFVVRDAPDFDDVVGPSPSPEAPTAAGNGGIFALALPIIMLCILSAGASSSFYIAHGLSLLKDFGHPLTAATTTLSIMAATTLVGNLTIGAVSKRFGVRRILAVGSITLAIGLLLLGNAHSTTMLYLYPPFFGIGFGAAQVGGMALLSKCVKIHRFAAISGIVFALDTVSSASAPVLGGMLFDKMHTYLPMILLLAGLNATAAVFLMLSKRLFPARA
jgi:MFS family permease